MLLAQNPRPVLKSAGETVKAYWKARVTSQRYQPCLAKMMAVSSNLLQLENDFNLKIGEKIKIEIAANFNGKSKVVKASGVVRSSVLRSSVRPYGLQVAIERITSDDQAFLQDYMTHVRTLAVCRSPLVGS